MLKTHGNFHKSQKNVNGPESIEGKNSTFLAFSQPDWFLPYELLVRNVAHQMRNKICLIIIFHFLKWTLFQIYVLFFFLFSSSKQYEKTPIERKKVGYISNHMCLANENWIFGFNLFSLSSSRWCLNKQKRIADLCHYFQMSRKNVNLKVTF